MIPCGEGHTIVKSETGWIPELDGLRGIACVLVLIAHFNPWLGGYVSPIFQPIKFFSPGNLGVTLFFCLSSFLLTSICLSEMERAGSIDAKTFLLRRALRIWPLYFSVLAATLFLISPYSPLPYGAGASTTDAQWSWATSAAPVYAIFLGNWLQQQISEVGIFWTICVEEQFYLALPFVLPIAIRSRHRFRWIVFSIAATALAVVSIPKFDFASEGYYQTTTYISTFCLGALGAAAFRRGFCRFALQGWAGLSTGIALTLILAALFPRFWWPPYGLSAAILYNVVPALLVLIVYCIAINSGTAGLRFLRSKPVRSVGILSYGIYLTHVLSHRFANLEIDLLGLSSTQPAIVYHLLFVQYFSFAVLLASITYGLIERPALDLRTRLIPGKEPSAIDSRWHVEWRRFATVSSAVTLGCFAVLSLIKGDNYVTILFAAVVGAAVLYVKRWNMLTGR